MYRNFYHLKERPFDHTPDPEFLYLSKSHREVLASMVYGITYAKGFILVAGDVGIGKTTLIQALLKELGPTFLVALINNPRPGFAEILFRLSKTLGIPFSETAHTLESYHHLKVKLEKSDKEGKRTVLIIDEAHLLSEECLENIRLLSNYETETRKLIQIVLVGQNEIYRTLQQDSLKSLKQRIVINRILEALDRNEVEKYIQHRLRVAGRQTPLFDRKARALIWEKSRGVPRVINHICDNALMTGYALSSRKIGEKIITEVIEDMESGYTTRKLPTLEKSPGRKLAFPAALVSAILILLLAGYILKNRHDDTGGKAGIEITATDQVDQQTPPGQQPAAGSINGNRVDAPAPPKRMADEKPVAADKVAADKAAADKAAADKAAADKAAADKAAADKAAADKAAADKAAADKAAADKAAADKAAADKAAAEKAAAEKAAAEKAAADKAAADKAAADKAAADKAAADKAAADKAAAEKAAAEKAAAEKAAADKAAADKAAADKAAADKAAADKAAADKAAAETHTEKKKLLMEVLKGIQ
ncbi:ExeA family protein [Desulfococcus sp.]|uniref:ExeA family protein n=1 Tax=Desulfococcus sp. TaxID=2025834 RepID=UPI003593F25A